MEKSPKDAFREFYPKLLEVLPMCVGVLVSTLYSTKMLSDSQKSKIDSFINEHEKSQCFLDEVIKPGIRIDYPELFHEMLRIMNKSDNLVVKHLAGEIMGNQMPTNASPKEPHNSDAELPLTKKLKREGHVHDEIKTPNITSGQFGILLQQILFELAKNEDKNLDTIKLICSCLTIEGNSELYFNAAQLKAIENCHNLRILFVDQLRGLWRWDDFPLLMAIVQPFTVCRELIKKYKSKLCIQMKLQHIHDYCHQEDCSMPDGYDKMIAIIENKNFSEITLEEYNELKQFTSKHCGVKSYVLCPFCKAGSHSLILEWFIPVTAIKHMVDTARRNTNAFILKGFVYLKISETEILDRANCNVLVTVKLTNSNNKDEAFVKSPQLTTSKDAQFTTGKENLLQYISEHIVPQWASWWRQLGTELGVDHHLMEIIEKDCPNDCQRCCFKMLEEWSDRVPSASVEGLIAATDKLSSHENQDVQAANELLCSHYSQSRYTPDEDDWPPYHPNHYTQLTIIQHKGKRTESEVTTIARKLSGDQISESKEHYISNIRDLFTPFNNSTSAPYRILIEGAPGIGKTVLSKEIAYRWSNHTMLTATKLLFLLFMRDPQINNITNVESLVKYFCESSTLTTRITDWLVKTEGKHLTIILDGHDEVSENNQNHFINDIVRRKKLAKCGLVITSRPTVLLYLHDIVDCRVEVLGFTEENRREFIENALSDQSDTLSTLESFLQSNPFISKLCYIPLNMSILLSLTEDGVNALPKTQTKLFEKFVVMTVVHFLKKARKVSTTSIASLNDIPDPHDQTVRELSQFAFLALQKDQLVFTLAEIRATCPNLRPTNWYGLGLLKSANYFKPQDGCDHESFHFLHLSIQEYMAAYYITSLPDQRTQTILENTFWNDHYFNTWMMYVSMTSGKSFAFTHFLSGNHFKISSKLFRNSVSKKILNNKIKCLRLVQCLAETDHPMLSSVERIFQGRIIDLSHQSLSLVDIHALAVLLLRSPSKRWDMLNLSYCNFDNDSCNAFCKMFESQAVTLRIDCIDISYNYNLWWECLNKLCKLFNEWHIKELILSINSLYNNLTMKRISIINKQLRSFVNVNKESDGLLQVTQVEEQNRLIAVYSNPDTIRCFQCSICNATIEDVKRFVQTIPIREVARVLFSFAITNMREKCTTLSNFRLTFIGTNMHAKGVYFLSNSKFQCQHEYSSRHHYVSDYFTAVISHDFHSSTSYLEALTAQHAKAIKGKISKHSNLRTLNISNNSLSHHGAKDIAVALSSSKELQSLHIHNNNIGATGLIKILRMINTSSLIQLNVSNNNIGSKAAYVLAVLLSHNHKLQSLYVHNNNLGTDGVIKIAKVLQRISCLRELCISSNDIGREAASDIGAVLHCNRNIHKFYAWGNNFKTDGIVEMLQKFDPSSLTELDISSSNIESDSADTIAAFLSCSRNLQKLYIGGNNLGTVGAIKIARGLHKITSLTELSISSNSIDSEAADEIAAVILFNVALEKFYIRGNNLGTSGIIPIAQALQNAASITELSFSNNNIDSKAANDIARSLSCSTKLEKFYIWGNDLRTEGTKKIAQAFLNISSLTELSISNNNIGSEAACDIANALSHHTRLQKLSIKDNNLGTDGAREIARALHNISSLTYLNMSKNNIGSEAANDIAAIVTHNVKLQRFYMQDNNLGTQGTATVIEAIQKSASIMHYEIGKDNIVEACTEL